jgi:hypothetical protein
MVPTLAPHVNVLATIMGATLDFFYFVVGGRLGLLALCATPSRGHRYHWTLIPARGSFGEEVSARGGVGALLSLAIGGVMALSPSSATLLGEDILVASSSLAGVLAPVLA